MAQQQSRKFTSAAPATRTGAGEIQEYEVASKIHRDPFFNPQSFQSRTTSLQSTKLQTQPFRCIGRVASTCKLKLNEARRSQVNSLLSDSASLGTVIRPPDLGPVDFATHKPPTSPNHYLVCPEGLCTQAQADMVSPIYPMNAAKLQAIARKTWAAEPRLEMVVILSGRSASRDASYCRIRNSGS